MNEGWAIEAGAEGKRRLTLRVIAVLALIGLIAAGLYARSEILSRSRAGERPLTVVQAFTNHTFPVQFVRSNGQFLKAAQTFTPPEKGASLSQVSPLVEWEAGDGTAYLSVYKLGTPDPESGTLLRTVPFELTHRSEPRFRTLVFNPPLAMESGSTFAFVLFVKDHGSALGIGQATYRNLYPQGTALYFARSVGPKGQVLDNYAWHGYNDDLAFRLVFVPRDLASPGRLRAPPGLALRIGRSLARGRSITLPQEREQKRTERKGGGGSSGEAGQAAGTEKAEKLKEEMDDILDEIDSVLEENAEEFVKSYVQKGGE